MPYSDWQHWSGAATAIDALERFRADEEDEPAHDCPGDPPCDGDPECDYAICESCKCPNNRCRCDEIYDRWKDERYDRY